MRNVIWHPYTQHQNMEQPIPIVRGEGALLFDEKGNSYIDAVSSWWVNLHGHATSLYRGKNLSAGAGCSSRSSSRILHTNRRFTLAERILQILPGKSCKIFYSDNGSTAVEVALKMAMQFWRIRIRPATKKNPRFRIMPIMAIHSAP